MKEKTEQLNKCLYCHSENFMQLFDAPDRFGPKSEERFCVCQCNNCGLVFQNPRVREEHIGQYYGDDIHYFNATPLQKVSVLGKLKLAIEKQVLIEFFNYTHLGPSCVLLRPFLFIFKRWQRVQMVPRFVPGGKLLDIGCSHGAYLMRMRTLGWEVVGQELHQKSAAYAQSLGIPVTVSRIEDTAFPPGSFDVITMGMVLEHIYDPFSVLRQITGWLKPGGTVIFAIPYFKGFEFKFFKEYAYGLQLPYHITFLDKKIIKEYLSSLGYQTIQTFFHFFDRDIAASAQIKYEERGGMLYRAVGHSKVVRVLVIKPLVWFLSAVGLTSRITVYAHHSIL